MSEDRPNPQEEADKLVAKFLGNLPERVGSVKKYVGNLVDVIHYYFDRFAPYLPSDQRKEWSRLVLLSDILYLEMESIRNSIEILENTIRKKSLLKEKIKLDNKKIKELDNKLLKLEVDANELKEETQRLLRKLIKYIEDVGIE